MSAPMPTARQIEAFRAVMITRSMSTAARMLSVTQSAVSKIMKELQEAVGFPLFIRRQSGLVPSAEAIALYAEVERLFHSLERIGEVAAQIKAQHSGNIRIAAMSSISTSLVGSVIKLFVSEHPAVKISIETCNSFEVINLVGSNLCDIGFAVAPVNKDSVRAVKQHQTALVCLLPAGHKLEGREVIKAEDLREEQYISPLNWNTTRLSIDAHFRSRNIERKLAYEAGWSATMAALVSEGLGVALIDPFTGDVAAALGCVVKPFKPEIPFSFVEIRPKDAAQNSLVEGFSEAFWSSFNNQSAVSV